MKKQILNLGKALSKADQKEINGGGIPPGWCRRTNGNTGQSCNNHSDCTVNAALSPVCHQGCCNTWV
jgi:hypothetical protein